MKKIAIIGASYLQRPLIMCAHDHGYETHVFAWEKGSVGAENADYFYPISIVDIDDILNVCKSVEIDAICTIASDLATITVNYIANEMGLVGNSLSCTKKTTNKFYMRQALSEQGLLCPRYLLVDESTNIERLDLPYPVIVKPTDRSGSRGVFLLNNDKLLRNAVEVAISESFERKAIIESYISGTEYSIEYLTFHGKHSFLAITQKYTTGAPRFIERGQFEPACLPERLLRKVKEIVEKALDVLEVTEGASHNEIIIDKNEKIWIVEIGARMGGDMIGSHLVKESTGIDMLYAVLQISLGLQPDLNPNYIGKAVGVRFVLDNEDLALLETIKNKAPNMVVESQILREVDGGVSNSAQRFGYIIISDTDPRNVLRYLE